jgi:hypothetical protein
MYNFKASPSIPHCKNVGQATVSPAHDSPFPKDRRRFIMVWPQFFQRFAQ